jgi:hypothetical protein
MHTRAYTCRVKKNIRQTYQFWRYSQLAFLAYTHIQESLVPAFDDLALADGEFEGGSADGGIELCAVGEEGARVVHFEFVACDGSWGWMEIYYSFG